MLATLLLAPALLLSPAARPAGLRPCGVAMGLPEGLTVETLTDDNIRALEGEELAETIEELTVAVFNSRPGDLWMEGKSRIRRKLVLAYAKVGDYAQLEPVAREVLKFAPLSVDPEMHYLIGTAVMQRGEAQIAAESFERAIELKPDYQEAIDSLQAARAVA